MPISKKIFITSSILLIIALLLWGIYSFSFKTPSERAEQAAQVEEKLKEKTESFLTKKVEAPDNSVIAAISEDSVLSPVYLPEERMIRYYSKSDERVYQIDPVGINRKVFAGRDFPGIVSAIWSPGGSKAILKVDENEKIKFYYYNYASKERVALKDNMDSIVWIDDDRIFYRYYDPLTRKTSLNIANPDGSNWKNIIEVEEKDIVISLVPKTGLVSLWNTPDAQTEAYFQLVSLLGTEGRTIFSGKFGAAYLWNTEGTKALVSHSDAKNGSKIRLATINSRGEEYQDFEIPTLVSKAVWSRDGKTVYYALPVSIPDQVVMPNDYINGKFNTADTFWKVDTSTGKKFRLVDLKDMPDKFDAANLFFNTDESFLFFVNKLDGKLYKISL